MAAPHVAGVAALVIKNRSDQGDSTEPADVFEQILNDGTKNVLSRIGTGSPNLLLHMPKPLTSAPTESPTKAYISTRCTKRELDFVLELFMDVFPEETYFDLVNDCNEQTELKVNAGDLSEGFHLYIYTKCLETRAYTLTMRDTHSDGLLLHDGKYSIIVDGEYIFKDRSDFTGSTQVTEFGDAADCDKYEADSVCGCGNIPYEIFRLYCRFFFADYPFHIEMI